MADQQNAKAGFAAAHGSASYMGERADQGTLTPGKLYPNEGFAVLKCGGTEVVLGYSLLIYLHFELHKDSPRWGEVADAIAAFHAITCEASLGRTPNDKAQRPGR